MAKWHPVSSQKREETRSILFVLHDLCQANEKKKSNTYEQFICAEMQG
jgi:hypothetical protein